MTQRNGQTPLVGFRTMYRERAVFRDSIEELGPRRSLGNLSLIARLCFPRSGAAVNLVKVRPEHNEELTELFVADERAMYSLRDCTTVHNIHKYRLGRLAVLTGFSRPLDIAYDGSFSMVDEPLQKRSDLCATVALTGSGAVELEPFSNTGIQVRANWAEAFGTVLPRQRAYPPAELGRLLLVRTQSA